MIRLRDLQTEAAAHLAAADPRLAALIEETGPLNLARRLEAAPHYHFGALCACLIGQRQSERDTIAQLAQFKAMFGAPFPSPKQILSIPAEKLAELLMSHRKADYLRSLALKIDTGTVHLHDLDLLSDGEVTFRLLAIKGIGAWSVEQILFWHLERPDVLVTGDPAVQRAFVSAFGLETFPSMEALQSLTATWRPYRSFVAHLLLQSRYGPDESISWPQHGRPARSPGSTRKTGAPVQMHPYLQGPKV